MVVTTGICMMYCCPCCSVASGCKLLCAVARHFNPGPLYLYSLKRKCFTSQPKAFLSSDKMALPNDATNNNSARAFMKLVRSNWQLITDTKGKFDCVTAARKKQTKISLLRCLNGAV